MEVVIGTFLANKKAGIVFTRDPRASRSKDIANSKRKFESRGSIHATAYKNEFQKESPKKITVLGGER